MNKKVFFLFGFGLLIMTAAVWIFVHNNTLKLQWTRQKTLDDQFNLNLPVSKPVETTTKQVRNIKMKTALYESVADGRTFSVGTIDYSDNVNLSEPKYNLISAVNNLVKNHPSRKIIYSRFNSYQGQQAIDYLIKDESKNSYILGKAFINKRRLYVLNLKTQKANDTLYEVLLNNFKLRDS